MIENKRFTFRVVKDTDGYDIIGFDIDDLDDEASYFVDTNTNCVESLVDLMNSLNDEGEHYKSIFFEIVETALTDKNCRELYCKGVLDIFDKATSLNQARDMIEEYLK